MVKLDVFKAIASLCIFAGAVSAGSVQLDPGVPSSFFTTSDFTTGLYFPLSMAQLQDGSIAVASGVYGNPAPSYLTQYALAGGTSSLIYTAANENAAVTGLAWAGGYLLYGANADSGANAIQVLQPGPTSSSAMTLIGSLNLTFPIGWGLPQMGIATRPTPGQPGSYDVVMNVGSEYNDMTSTDPVAMTGLITATLQGDSLYMVTLTFQGSQVTASNLIQIATGIRNSVAMGFDPATGDFYFADNAIDGPAGPPNDDDPDPPQADELNVIRAADMGKSVINFGYPSCYIEYMTGTPIGSGCVQPLVAFQPINGVRTQGPTQLAFAPPNYPAGYNHGIFVSFAGEEASGAGNDDDGVIYYSLDTGQYTHFIPSAEATVGKSLGLLATDHALYMTDYNYGYVEAITAALTAVPSSQVAATASGLAYSRVTRTYNGTVTIRNVGATTIAGPFQIAFTSLPAAVTMANASNTVNGTPYLTVSGIDSLAPGLSATVSVQFINPAGAVIHATPVVYSGN